MSIWTHVSATIRIDDLNSIFGNNSTDLSKVFIRDTWQHSNKNGNLPTGSEGSLDVEFIERPENDGGQYMKTVCIFGDLRDYEDLAPIHSWWLNIKNNLPKGCDIRQGILLAECENGKKLILTDKDMK